MFSWDTLIAVAIITVTAKIFDFLGYSRCYAEVCNAFDFEGDELLEKLNENDKNI